MNYHFILGVSASYKCEVEKRTYGTIQINGGLQGDTINFPGGYYSRRTNGKITTSDNKVCTWNATRYSTQTAGFATLPITDDEYTGGGQSAGIGFNGKPFEAVSTNIVWRLNCKYLVSGTVTINSNNDPEPVIVDFGNGVCDKKYNVAYDIYNADLEFWY